MGGDLSVTSPGLGLGCTFTATMRVVDLTGTDLTKPEEPEAGPGAASAPGADKRGSATDKRGSAGNGSGAPTPTGSGNGRGCGPLRGGALLSAEDALSAFSAGFPGGPKYSMATMAARKRTTGSPHVSVSLDRDSEADTGPPSKRGTDSGTPTWATGNGSGGNAAGAGGRTMTERVRASFDGFFSGGGGGGAAAGGGFGDAAAGLRPRKRPEKKSTLNGLPEEVVSAVVSSLRVRAIVAEDDRARDPPNAHPALRWSPPPPRDSHCRAAASYISPLPLSLVLL